MKITSVNNELIKETAKLQQRKYRDETGLFLLEGEKCINEALQYGLKLKTLFVLEGYDKITYPDLIEVSEPVMSKISTTVTAPKAVAVAYQRKSDWSACFSKVVLLEDIKDAGNLGTIIRTSCAFGTDAIILYGDTVDLYNPKCVRASVGNLWKIPVFNAKNIKELKNLCNEYNRVATLPKGENTIELNNYKPNKKILLMFGTEGAGLSDELKNFATENITIEMSKDVESLNLSISAGIILYKLYKN